MNDIRIPPHSIGSEQAVIGSIFLRNESLDLLDGLTSGDFYKRAHAVIYDAMLALSLERSPIDIVTVSEWLEARGALEEVGGLAYLGQIAHDTPSAASVAAYAKRVMDQSRLRRLIAAGTWIADNAWDAPDAAQAVDDAQAKIMALSDSTVKGPETMRQHLRGFISELERRAEGGDELTGISSGNRDLDRITNGFQAQDLIILAARPSMGKTALAMNFVQAVIAADKSALVISAEMSASAITKRLCSAMSLIPFDHVRRARFDDHHWPPFTEASRVLADSKLLIDDTSNPSISHIRATARKAKREIGLDLIVVDYLTLLKGTGENRTQEVGSISRGLKAIAKELDVPMVALSQLNRGLESRSDKRPRLSDLRDSGEIEQDADVVLFLYRDEVYNPDSARIGCAELQIAKHRNGELGLVGLATRLDVMRFEHLSGVLPDLHEDSPKPARGIGGAKREIGEAYGY